MGGPERRLLARTPALAFEARVAAADFRDFAASALLELAEVAEELGLTRRGRPFAAWRGARTSPLLVEAQVALPLAARPAPERPVDDPYFAVRSVLGFPALVVPLAHSDDLAWVGRAAGAPVLVFFAFDGDGVPRPAELAWPTTDGDRH